MALHVPVSVGEDRRTNGGGKIKGSVSVPLALLTGLLVGSAPAAAQQRVDYVGYVGAYVPLNSAINEPNAEFQQQTGLSIGGRGTLWLEEALAVEGGFVFGFSDVEMSGVAGQTTEGGHVWAASGRALYRPFQTEGAVLIHLGGGLAIIGRGGDTYTNITGTTDIGGTVGVGASFAVARGFSIRIEAEDYFYWAKFNPDLPLETGTRFQNDLVFSAGLAGSIVR